MTFKMTFLEYVAQMFNDFVQAILLCLSLAMSAFLVLSLNLWVAAIFVFILTVLFLVGIRWLRDKFSLFIKERELGVVFHKKGNFARFIKSGHHCIDSWQHEVKIILRRKGNKVVNELAFRTKEGIFVNVNYESKYEFDFDKLTNLHRGNLTVKQKDKLLDTIEAGLLVYPYGKVAGTTVGAVRAVIEQKMIRELYLTRNDDGLLSELANEMTEKLQLWLSGPDSILTEDSGKVTIKQISLPTRIEDALEEAYERKLYTEAVRRSLEHLDISITKMNEEVSKRLADFERLRVMAKKDATNAVFVDVN